MTCLALNQTNFFSLTLPAPNYFVETAGSLATTFLLLLYFFFSPSFLNGVVETQRGGREETAIYSSTQSLLPTLQERIGEGNPVFLGHELVKHMMASECLGIIGNARIWTQS